MALIMCIYIYIYIYIRSSVSSINGHSSAIVKKFYLLKDREADAAASREFSQLLAEASGITSPSTVGPSPCITSSSYSSLDPQKRIMYVLNIYLAGVIFIPTLSIFILDILLLNGEPGIPIHSKLQEDKERSGRMKKFPTSEDLPGKILPHII